MNIKITGSGSYIPTVTVKNKDFSNLKNDNFSLKII
jgi:3-oxoacyl-[acyl-carrier-protein] synthase III